MNKQYHNEIHSEMTKDLVVGSTGGSKFVNLAAKMMAVLREMSPTTERKYTRHTGL